MRLTSVDLPDPVLPMTAKVSPAFTDTLTSNSTGCSAFGYENPTPRISSEGEVDVGVIGVNGGTTDDSVSRTSMIRSADTDARGYSAPMKVAIMTAIRICTR